jgi:hypothetical protein
MSENEDAFIEQIERWEAKQAKHQFLAKMERKLHRKERFGS